MAAFIFTSRSIGTIQKNNVCIHTLQYRASGIVLGGHVTVVQLPDQYTLIEQSSVCVFLISHPVITAYQLRKGLRFIKLTDIPLYN